MALPTTALDSCDGLFCYDDDLPIDVGDVLSWTLFKENTGDEKYRHQIDKGLPTDFAVNLGEPVTIEVEIIKDIKGVDFGNFYTAENTYFDTTIFAESAAEAESRLFETLLIYPTIRNAGSELLNDFEFITSLLPTETFTFIPRPDHHEITVVTRHIDEEVYIKVTILEIADSEDRSNIILNSQEIQIIHIPTGVLISHTLEIEDIENDAVYSVEFLLAQQIPIQSELPLLSELLNDNSGTTLLKLDRNMVLFPLVGTLAIALIVVFVVVISSKFNKNLQ